MWFWLAMLGLAQGAEPSDGLAPAEIMTTDGRRLVCWQVPAPVGELGGPVDVRVRVGSRQMWAAQRCADSPAPGTPVGLVGAPAQAPAPPGPLRWHGPAREAALLPGEVQEVDLADDGALWFARCRSGLTRLDPLRGERRTWTVSDGLPTGCITRVATAPDGSAWALTPDRAVRVDPKVGVVEIEAFDPEDQASVAALLVTGAGRVWLAGQGGRLRGLFDDAAVRTRFNGATLGALDTVEHLTEGPDGRLWLSSRDRITVVDPRVGTFDVRVSHGADPGLPPGRPGPVVHAADGPWVVVQPERDGPRSSALVRLTKNGFERLALPGIPERPLQVHGGDDGALWVTDREGIVRIDPARSDARRVAVRRGFVPGGPWVAPTPDGGAWAAFEGQTSGATLARLQSDGSVARKLQPAPLPPVGALVRENDGVLLATPSGFWRLDPTRARWEPHPGFGEGVRGTTPTRLSAIHTDGAGRTWLAGRDGLRVVRRDGVGTVVELPESQAVLDVYSQGDGTVLIAGTEGVYARDRVGRLLKVVDDGGRPLSGVSRIEPGPAGRVWAWGEGGAWTVQGSDAERRLGPGVLDLVVDGRDLWVARADGVRKLVEDRFERQSLPRWLAGPQQIAIRDGALAQVRTRRGLWRFDGDKWRRAVGVDGPFERSGDGTLWRWDPDGLHVLPTDAVTWRWVGLVNRERGVVIAEPPPIAADAVVVHALAGVLAVEVEGVVVGEPDRPDPIVDLHVRGTRWAALSRRGVLLRGDGYRLIERSYVPGPARRVALGPRQVCVAGTTVWCRQKGRWSTVLDVLDLPAPVPAVDLDVDDEGRAWSLHPGALCRQGRPCRGLPGLSQTSLALQRGYAWVGALQGLYRVDEAGRRVLVRPSAPVLDLAASRDGTLWLATEGEGLVQWSDDDLRVVGLGRDPTAHDARAPRQVAVSRSGHVWVRQGTSRLVLPGPVTRQGRWPWQARR